MIFIRTKNPQRAVRAHNAENRFVFLLGFVLYDQHPTFTAERLIGDDALLEGITEAIFLAFHARNLRAICLRVLGLISRPIRQALERVFAVKKDPYNNPPSVFISRDVYFQWLIARLRAVLSRSTIK